MKRVKYKTYYLIQSGYIFEKNLTWNVLLKGWMMVSLLSLFKSDLKRINKEQVQTFVNKTWYISRYICT